jgi:hypothetical protein
MQSRLFAMSVAAVILVSASAVAAQFPPSAYNCVMENDIPRGGGTLRMNGFTVEIEPDTSPSALACHVSIRSPQGEIVYEGNNNLGGIDIDRVTGKDINGDGHPDAVVIDDSGSAHHNDFGYTIISLGPKPGIIQQLDGIAGFEDLKRDGKIEIVLGAGFFGFHDVPTPYTPGSHLVLRLSGNRLEDISTQFPKTYDDEIQWDLKNLKFHKVTIAEDGDDQSSVLSIVFAYLYSDRPAQARKFLDQHWPAADRQSIRKEILSAFCNGRHKELKLPMPSVCSAGDF